MAESSRHLKVENDERDLSTTGTDASQNFAKTSKSSLVSSEFSDEAIAIRDSDWRQMRCKSQELTYGKFWVQCIYVIIAIIFVPIGIVTYNASQDVTYQEFSPYSKEDACGIDEFEKNATWGHHCNVTYTIDDNFEAPIYFYYKVSQMYVNHRSYVMSRNDAQLRGHSSSTSDCDPMASYDGKDLVACGLISYSFFNDKFKVTYIDADGTETELCDDTDQCYRDEHTLNWTDASWHSEPNWSKKHIAWSSDRSERFDKAEINPSSETNVGELQEWQDITLPDTDDEDFIVWMRTGTVQDFYKLHRIVKEKDFKKGDTLRITIANYFEVNSFSGSKRLVISTVGNLGGRNDALGICFMVVGSISLLTAVLFCVFFHSSRYPDVSTTNANTNNNDNDNNDKNDTNLQTSGGNSKSSKMTKHNSENNDNKGNNNNNNNNNNSTTEMTRTNNSSNTTSTKTTNVSINNTIDSHRNTNANTNTNSTNKSDQNEVYID